jgi:membrane-associated phospholipid phosphatase
VLILYGDVEVMNAKKAWKILLIIVLIANGLLAQDRPFPYEFKKKDFLLIPLGLGMTALGESLSDNYDPITLEEIRLLGRNDVNGFDRRATYNWSPEWSNRSDKYRNALVYSSIALLTVPPLFHAKLSETATVAVMFLEASLFLSGITYLTKVATGRIRPYLYNTSLSVEERHVMGGNDAYFSFLSGHVVSAFTTATFLSKVMTDIHGDSLWTKLLWGSSLTVAALTGYARVKAGKHYPTDVIASAVVGFAIGYLIPTLHKTKKNDRVSLIISPNRIGLSFQF